MKRIIALALIILVVSSACLSVAAQDAPHHDCDIEHMTVILEENSVFTEAQQLHITEYLTHDHNNEGIVAFGILCLFGHNYITEGAITITHCVNSSHPRCLQEYFLVSICSRCDKTIIERSGYAYITCCP